VGALLHIAGLVDDQHRVVVVEVLDDVFAHVVADGVGVQEARHSRCCMRAGWPPRPTPRSSSSFARRSDSKPSTTPGPQRVRSG